MTMTLPRPTPMDVLARQANRDLAAGLLQVPVGESFRLLWERGVLRSSMIANHRLVALTLAVHADPTTGDIASDHQPYDDGLVRETALSRGQVDVALKNLLQRGWISRRDPRDQYRGFDVCPLRLAIPALLVPRLRHK